MEPIKPKPPEPLPVKEMSTDELPYAAPNFGSPVVLNQITNDLADFIEETGEATIYRLWIKTAVKKALDKLKLPGIFGFFKKLIVKYILAWAVDNALDLAADLLRGIGKKK